MIAKSPDVLFCDLYDLQRAGVMVDTRLILEWRARHPLVHAGPL